MWENKINKYIYWQYDWHAAPFSPSRRRTKTSPSDSNSPRRHLWVEPQAEATSDPVLTRTSRPRCTERHHTVMSETLAPPGCPVSTCTHSSHIPRDLTVRVQRDSTERLRGRRQNCRIRKTHTHESGQCGQIHISVYFILDTTVTVAVKFVYLFPARIESTGGVLMSPQ